MCSNLINCIVNIVKFNRQKKQNRMKKSWIMYLLAATLFYQCGTGGKANKNLGEENPVPLKTPEQQAAEEKIRQDSIENAALLEMQKTAFGDLKFGMSKNEVESLNAKRQLLGKYNYNFSYSFDGENNLYKVKLSSDGIKTIEFDSALKNNYNNLLQIVKTKYGDATKNNGYPSVFDVQNSKKYMLNSWELGTKQISIGLQQNSLNNYSVYCEISDVNLQEAELNRLNRVKNKDIIQASEKF